MSEASPDSGLFQPTDDPKRDRRREGDDVAASPLQPALQSPDAAPADAAAAPPHIPPAPDLDRLSESAGPPSREIAGRVRDVPVIIASARIDGDPADESPGEPQSPTAAARPAAEPAHASADPAASTEPKLTWAERARRGLLTGPTAGEPAAESPSARPRPAILGSDSSPRSSAASPAERPHPPSAGHQDAPADAAASPAPARESASTDYPVPPSTRSAFAATAAVATPTTAAAPVATEKLPVPSETRPAETADSNALATLAGSLQRIERTLGEIRAVLDAGAREERYKEFSLPRLIAPLAQLGALALLLFALLDWVFGREVGWLLAKLGFACAVQLVALTATVATTGHRGR